MSPRTIRCGSVCFGGGIDFAAVLAQLGRNVVEVERVIDLLLGGCRDDDIVFQAQQGVLAECEAALDGALAQRDVVHLGAGEVLQRGAVAGARQQPYIDLEIVAQGEADLVLSAREQLVDEREGGDMLDRGGDYVRLAGWAGDEQVEVADRLAAAPQRACWRDRLDSGEEPDEFADALRVLARHVDAKARGVLAIVLDALEQLVGKLLAHARQRQQVAALGGFFQAVDVVHAEGGVDQRHGLRAHAGKAQQLQHGWLVALQQAPRAAASFPWRRGRGYWPPCLCQCRESRAAPWDRRRPLQASRAAWSAALPLPRRGDRSECETDQLRRSPAVQLSHRAGVRG